MSKAAKMYATNKFLTAKCLVIRRKLEREFIARPPKTDEPCRWEKLGIYDIVVKLAKRYKSCKYEIITCCSPRFNAKYVVVEPRCVVKK